jgi:hypothetical protein
LISERAGVPSIRTEKRAEKHARGPFIFYLFLRYRLQVVTRLLRTLTGGGEHTCSVRRGAFVSVWDARSAGTEQTEVVDVVVRVSGGSSSSQVHDPTCESHHQHAHHDREQNAQPQGAAIADRTGVAPKAVHPVYAGLVLWKSRHHVGRPAVHAGQIAHLHGSSLDHMCSFLLAATQRIVGRAAVV